VGPAQIRVGRRWEPQPGNDPLPSQIERGSIPRADVAAVLAAVLADRGGDRTIEVVGGKSPIDSI